MRLTITGEIDNPDQRICQAQRGGGAEGLNGRHKDFPKGPVQIPETLRNTVCQLQWYNIGTGITK